MLGELVCFSGMSRKGAPGLCRMRNILGDISFKPHTTGALNLAEYIFSSRVVFFEWSHLELKIIRKKVLLSVTLGEPTITRAYRDDL